MTNYGRGKKGREKAKISLFGKKDKMREERDRGESLSHGLSKLIISKVERREKRKKI